MHKGFEAENAFLSCRFVVLNEFDESDVELLPVMVYFGDRSYIIFTLAWLNVVLLLRGFGVLDEDVHNELGDEDEDLDQDESTCDWDQSDS